MGGVCFKVFLFVLKIVLVFLVLVVLVVVFVLVVVMYDLLVVIVCMCLLSGDFLFGIDCLGCDIFFCIVYGV